MVEPGGSRRRYGIAVVLGVVALLSAFAVPALIRWGRADQSVSTERLRFATVERSPFVRDVAVTGRIVAAVSPTLYSTAPGTVTLHVASGDNVIADEILAVVESPELSSQLAQELATLSSLETDIKRQEIESRQRQLTQRKAVDDARVALTAAERELRRATSAFEKDAISEIDFEKADDDLERARLEFEHASAEMELLIDRLAFEIESQNAAVRRQQLLVDELNRRIAELSVRSPVTGMVGNLLIDEKAFVAANQALLSVVDLTALEVEISVPESYADALVPGLEARIRWGSTEVGGSLRAISPEIENNQITGRIRFADPSIPGLRQNQRVSARVVLESRPDALIVRRGPFYDSGAGRQVFVVEGDSAARRNIVTGAVSVEHVEILDGLSEGETIILSSLDAFSGADAILLNQ